MIQKIIFFLSFLFSVKTYSQSVISANKMNILYIGIDNPIRVAIDGVNCKEIEVQGSGVNISGSNGAYVVRVDRPGEARIKVLHKGKVINEHFFRVKRIPDPFAQLPLDYGNNPRGGSIKVDLFRKMEKLMVELEGFDMDLKCAITSFQFVRIPPESDPVVLTNISSVFSKEVKEAIQRAQIRDIYYFDDIKARCPGDDIGRPVNSLVFNMN